MARHWHRKRRLRKDGQPFLENRWHTFLMSTFSDAANVWWAACEAETSMYPGDIREYKERNGPEPQLKDFMIRLGREWRHGNPEHWADVAHGSA